MTGYWISASNGSITLGVCSRSALYHPRLRVPGPPTACNPSHAGPPRYRCPALRHWHGLSALRSIVMVVRRQVQVVCTQSLGLGAPASTIRVSGTNNNTPSAQSHIEPEVWSRVFRSVGSTGSQTCNSRGRPIESGCSFDTRVFRLLYSGLTNLVAI
eukprot:3786872-Rhodomonas_salina.2